MDIIMNPTE